MNSKKSFFSQVAISVKDFELYKYFIEDSKTNTLKYLFKLMLVFCLVICIGIACIMIDFQNTIYTQIDSSISELNFNNKELTVNSNNETILNYSKYVKINVIINTADNVDLNNYYNNVNENTTNIVVLKDKLIILLNGQSMTKTYEELKLPINEIGKTDIMQIFSNGSIYYITIMTIIIVFSIMLILLYISLILDSIILAALGFINCKILKIKMPFEKLFNLAAHSMTLSVILNLIQFLLVIFTGITIKYFNILYAAIGYIYLTTTILLLKSECIELARAAMKEKQNIKQNDNLNEQENNIKIDINTENGNNKSEENNNTKGEE